MFLSWEVERVSVTVADEQAVERLFSAAIFIVDDAISPLFCDSKQTGLGSLEFVFVLVQKSIFWIHAILVMVYESQNLTLWVTKSKLWTSSSSSITKQSILKIKKMIFNCRRNIFMIKFLWLVPKLMKFLESFAKFTRAEVRLPDLFFIRVPQANLGTRCSSSGSLPFVTRLLLFLAWQMNFHFCSTNQRPVWAISGVSTLKRN